MTLAGTSRVTTARAATTLLSPIVTPLSTVAWSPSHTLSPMCTGVTASSRRVRS
jgi:hypothetical protein